MPFDARERTAMSSYLVTGGAGFIGSNIVEELAKRNESVRVLDNCSTGSLSNLQDVIDQIEFIQADIQDLRSVRIAVKDMDYVIHQAGVSSVLGSIEDPIGNNAVNVAGTLNLLVAARDANVKRLVYASSASVYGSSSGILKKESMPVNPISPYAVSKCTCEHYCKVFYELDGLETVALRYFNVFGQKQLLCSQHPPALIAFIRAFLEGKSPVIFGDGKQSRDFVFVEDVVRANLLACNVQSAAGQIFNIASGKSTSIDCLVRTIRGLLGASVEPVYERQRRGDVRHSQADISKAKEILGYQPLIDLETGLEKTIEWFKASLSPVP